MSFEGFSVIYPRSQKISGCSVNVSSCRMAAMSESTLHGTHQEPCKTYPAYREMRDEDLQFVIVSCFRFPSSPQAAFTDVMNTLPDFFPSLQMGFSAFQDLFYTICCYEEGSLDYESPLAQDVVDRITRVRDFLEEASPRDEDYMPAATPIMIEDDHLDIDLDIDELLEQIDVPVEADETGFQVPGSWRWESRAQVLKSPPKQSQSGLPAPTNNLLDRSSMVGTVGATETDAKLPAISPETQASEDENQQENVLAQGHANEVVVEEEEEILGFNNLEYTSSDPVEGGHVPSLESLADDVDSGHSDNEDESPKQFEWPSIAALRFIKWGFLICAIYRSVSGRMDTAVVPGLVGPTLAASLAHILMNQPMSLRYNFVLFVYGIFGCLAAYFMRGYRGLAWLTPSILSIINPLCLLCRVKGWTVQKFLRFTNYYIRVSLGLLGSAYYPVMTGAYSALGLVVVGLGAVEFIGLVQMLRSEDTLDTELGQQGLQLAMLAVLAVLVQSLGESFSCRRRRSEETFDMDEDLDGGISFFWLNLIVCVVLGTIAGVYKDRKGIA